MDNWENFFKNKKDESSAADDGIDMEKIRAAASGANKNVSKEQGVKKINSGPHKPGIYHTNDDRPKNDDLLDDYYNGMAARKVEEKNKKEQKKREQAELKLRTLRMKKKGAGSEDENKKIKDLEDFLKGLNTNE